MRPRSSILALLGLLFGCASIPVQRVHAEPPSTLLGLGAREPAPEATGSCRPSLRVEVVDAEGRPVRGARVVAEQTVSEHAAEETIATYAYRAEVLSDEQGAAQICDPGRLDPGSRWEGLGGGFSVRSKGQLVISSDDGYALALPPFPERLRVVLWKPTWGRPPR